MRLKLTLEYDGTAFRGWAAQPGLRDGRGRAARRARRGLRVGRGPRRRGPHGHRGPRAREGRPRRRRGRPAARARGGGAQRRACRTTSRSSRRRQPRRTSTRASRAVAHVPLPPLRRARALAVRGTAPWWLPRPLDEDGLDASARRCSRRARLPRVHADRDAARGFVRVVERGGVGSSGRPSRLRDHGRQLPAAHGANARRDDARGGPTSSRALLDGPPRERGGHDRAAAGASTSWGSVLR